jgi:tRNA-specific 2-thiouridylase
MRVVVAMSGGVDSSVVAGLLQEQGHEVVGVHMKLHDVPVAGGTAAPQGGEKRCCGFDDALDARKVADRLGIPFYVLNLREAFQKAVVDDLADEYVAGRTPNPCIQCNGVLKFKVLLARALALGADALATGHYARVVDGQLHAARDAAKDQTYFLYNVTPVALQKTLFPLGDLTKAEVRAHAARMGLVTAEKPESQEICFVPDGDHAAFVRSIRPEIDAAGEIVDENGRVIGHHDAYYRFTVGQRRGLGISLGRPAYVVRVEPDTKRVVVGFEGSVTHGGLVAGGFNWYARPEPDRVVQVRIRHRGALLPCTVGEGDPAEVKLLEAGWAVSPGQAAVFYDGGRVLGGGTIVRALAPIGESTQAVSV